jgi:hypothetical protein
LKDISFFDKNNIEDALMKSSIFKVLENAEIRQVHNARSALEVTGMNVALKKKRTLVREIVLHKQEAFSFFNTYSYLSNFIKSVPYCIIASTQYIVFSGYYIVKYVISTEVNKLGTPVAS